MFIVIFCHVKEFSLSLSLPASLPPCLPASLPPCLPASLPPCLPASLPPCLPPSLPPSLFLSLTTHYQLLLNMEDKLFNFIFIVCEGAPNVIPGTAYTDNIMHHHQRYSYWIHLCNPMTEYNGMHCHTYDNDIRMLLLLNVRRITVEVFHSATMASIRAICDFGLKWPPKTRDLFTLSVIAGTDNQ